MQDSTARISFHCVKSYNSVLNKWVRPRWEPAYHQVEKCVTIEPPRHSHRATRKLTAVNSPVSFAAKSWRDGRCLLAARLFASTEVVSTEGVSEFVRVKRYHWYHLCALAHACLFAMLSSKQVPFYLAVNDQKDKRQEPAKSAPSPRSWGWFAHARRAPPKSSVGTEEVPCLSLSLVIGFAVAGCSWSGSRIGKTHTLEILPSPRLANASRQQFLNGHCMANDNAFLTLPRELHSLFATVLLVVALLVHLGCGSGSSSGGGGEGPPSIISVRVSGPSYTQSGLCANFTATVSGTGNFDHSVQWYANGTAGGDASSGLINSGGSYCAPANLPSTNPVTIKAVANGDATKSGSETTAVVSIQISPGQAQLYVNGTQQFSATVAGPSSSVSWQVSGIPGGNSTVGTISANGLYTAPAQVTNQSIAVEAVLPAASSIYASANLTVSGLINISPSNPQVRIWRHAAVYGPSDW